MRMRVILEDNNDPKVEVQTLLFVVAVVSKVMAPAIATYLRGLSRAIALRRKDTRHQYYRGQAELRQTTDGIATNQSAFIK